MSRQIWPPLDFSFFWLKKIRVYISSSFSVIGLKYSDIFFMHLISKNDKNPNLTVKNSSLYKLEFTVTLQYSKFIGGQRKWCF